MFFQQMVQSYKYAEVTWKAVFEKSTLEIVRLSKNSGRPTTTIRTRQAGVIDHLMRQLKQMNAVTDRPIHI